VKADKELMERGPLFGPWTEAQHKAASFVMAYIVIDDKNCQWYFVIGNARSEFRQSSEFDTHLDGFCKVMTLLNQPVVAHILFNLFGV